MKTIGENGDLQKVLDEIWAAQERCIRERPYLLEQYRAREAKRAEEEKYKPYDSCGIPRAIAEVMINRKDEHGRRIKGCRLMDDLKSALSEGKRLIILSGIVGTGKTLTACFWLLKQYDGLYVKSRSICSLSDHQIEDRVELKKYATTNSLVIDEVTMTDDRDRKRIESILHDRCDDNRLITVVCMHAAPKDASKILGDHLARRVAAYGKLIIAQEILCPGELRRRKQDKAK